MNDELPGKSVLFSCALCGNKLETFTERIPFTDLEDVVLVRCQRCKNLIYARKESRIVESARWKATA